MKKIKYLIVVLLLTFGACAVEKKISYAQPVKKEVKVDIYDFGFLISGFLFGMWVFKK